MKFKTHSFFKSFYFLTGAFFLVWVLFFDSNDVVSQVKLHQTIHDLESQKEYYQENIKEVSELKDLRDNNIEYIEKYARERYLMKKDTEDVFIIVEDE